MTGKSAYRWRIVRNNSTPSSPEVVSAVKFMSWITTSADWRASVASPSSGVSATKGRISCSESNSDSASPTAGLSSMISTVRIRRLHMQAWMLLQAGRLP